MHIILLFVRIPLQDEKKMHQHRNDYYYLHSNRK